MMAQKMKLQGADELKRLLRRLPQNVEKRVLQSAVRAGANVLKNEAVARAPVGQDDPHPKYGRLRDNIKVVSVERRSGYVRLAVTTGKAFWARFLEFGTRHMAARPFLRPAFDLKREEAVRKLGDSLGRGVEREALKLAKAYRTAKRSFGLR